MRISYCYLFQAEDGIRYLVRSRGLGDVYKRQHLSIGRGGKDGPQRFMTLDQVIQRPMQGGNIQLACLLYTSDAADERSSVDLGGRRIIQTNSRREHEVAAQTTHKNIE